MQRDAGEPVPATVLVSILTGPEGPMQQQRARERERQQGVSILTGPEGPMQQPDKVKPGTRILFQSSPAPKGRCNVVLRALTAMDEYVSILTGPEGPMQRHRHSPADHAYRVSILTGPEGPMQLRRRVRLPAKESSFNPHRPRRADATAARVILRVDRPEFQSSPAPKGRCNGRRGR